MLSKLVSIIYDRPLTFLGFWLSLTIVSAFLIQENLTVDVSLEQLQKPSSASYIAYKKNLSIFGSDESLMLLITAPDLLTDQGLKRLSRLQQDIAQNLPNISLITSIVSIPIIQKKDDAIILSSAFDPWPEGEEEWHHRLSLITSEQPGAEVIRSLISKDQRSTLMIIGLKNDGNESTNHTANKVKRYHQMSADLENIVARHQLPDFQVAITGQARLLAKVYEVLVQDLYILPAAALGVSILALLVLFRRKSGVVLPALVIVLPMTTTLALMSVTDSPIQIPTGMLPPSIVVVSVAFCVHIMTTFFSYYESESSTNQVDLKRRALLNTFESKANALSMSMLSTVVALLTFGLSGLTPIANIGLFGAFGVWMAYISIIVVVPVYVRLFSIKPKSLPKQASAITRWFIRIPLDLCGQLAVRFPRLLIVSAIAIMIAAAAIASHISFSHKPSEWLPHGWKTYQVSHQVNEQFSSMISIELLFDSGSNNGVYSAEFIRYLDSIQQEINQIPYQTLPAGIKVSLSKYLDQLSKMLNRQDDNNPRTDNHLSTYLSVMRLVAPKVLNQLVDSTGRYTRLIIRVPTLDGKDYVAGIERLENILQAQRHPAYITWVTGQASLIAATQEALKDSAKLSYALSLVVILLMMMIHLSSVGVGTLMMIPNLLPIILVLAIMQVTQTPLDFLNILIVTLSMGLVVDDTIHFTGHFKRHYHRTQDAARSVKLAIEETGQAMVITTLVLMLGWHMLLFSQFEQLGLFGILTSAIMVFGLIADLLVAPALLIWLYSRKSAST